MSFKSVVYETGVKLTGILLPLIAKLSGSQKLSQFVSGRKNQSIHLPRKGNSIRYWFHCASLGEFEQARPVIEQLKQGSESVSVVVSFFSPSGYEQRKNYPLAEGVFYLPLDTRKKARQFIDAIQPDAAVFVKYEIWYFHLRELERRKIKTYLLSAVFRKNQYILSWCGQWLLDRLRAMDRVFLQDESSFRLLSDKGLDNLTLTGDTRYDRVKQHAIAVNRNEKLEQFKGNKRLLVMGSSWPSEERIIREVLNDEWMKDFKVLIAPHDIGEKHLSEIMQLFADEQPTRYTDSLAPDSRIMVLDTIGHLASAYFYGDLAFVGGAFGKGLHNILEPLAYGVPVVFGPTYQKYPEAQMAIDSLAAISVSDSREFINAVRFYLGNEEIEFADFRTRCTDFISINSGACGRVMPWLQNNSPESLRN